MVLLKGLNLNCLVNMKHLCDMQIQSCTDKTPQVYGVQIDFSGEVFK